jgi:hypothetical protein
MVAAQAFTKKDMIMGNGFVRKVSGQIALVVAALLGVLTTGCADHDAQPARLDVASDPTSSDSEADWLRKQQAVHVVYISASGTRSEYDATPYDLMRSLQGCQTSRPEPTLCHSWYQGIYGVLAHLCTARTMLALATPQSEPIKVSGGTIILDRVTEPAAVQFATYAIKHSSFALRIALNQLVNPTPCMGTSGVWPANELGTLSLQYASSAVEAYYLGKAGYERAVEATVNAADKLASSTGSEQLAIQRSISGAELSRAAAAHLLVGGDPGILGSTTQGFCLGPDLSPQARSALQLLRDAAPAPTKLSGTLDTVSLLNTGNDSIRQRLGEFYDVGSLRNGEPVEAYYGLSKLDFDAARAYLNQESAAFTRSPSATLGPVSGSMLRRYAGVYGEPRALPKGAWAARARYSQAPPLDYIQATGEWDYYWDEESDLPPFGLDAFIASVHTKVRSIAGTANSYAGSGDDAELIKKQVLSTLNSITLSNEYKGALEIGSSPDVLTAYAIGFTAASKVRVVAGEDGLRCAVDGDIEGASCEDAATPAAYPCDPNADPTLSCLTVYRLPRQLALPAGNTYGDREYVTTANGLPSISSENIASLVDGKVRLYFVALKDSALAEEPGNYQLLGSVIIPNGTNPDGSPITTGTPIVPAVQARVDEILAPSRKYCGIQEVSCTGIATDARLPLENELTDDNNGVESSWKHYLSLATQAANESDLLGAELRAAKLNSLQGEAAEELRQEEQLQAAENALQEVQAACGTAIDPKRLLTLLSTPENASTQPDLAGIYGGQACPCAPDSGMTCVAGVCVTDLVALAEKFKTEPDILRLKDCLDDSPAATAPFVTLGRQPLCVYTAPGNPNKVCPADLVGTNACPSLKSDTPPCPTITGPAPASVVLDAYEAEPLFFYGSESPENKIGACQLFRQLRTNHTTADLKSLIATNVFHPGRLRDRVGRLGFLAKYGGFASITEDGAERWSTGSASAGKAAGWPWTTPASCSTATSNGLFCATTSDAQRGAFHTRLFHAVVAAEWIRKGVLPEIEFPVAIDSVFGQSRPWLLDQCAAGGTRRTIYEPSPGNAPILVCSREVRDHHPSTYVNQNLGINVGWHKFDGSTLLSPLNFVRQAYGSRLDARHVDDFAIFSGISSSPLSLRRDRSREDAWMKEALLNNALENKYPDVFSINLNGYDWQALTGETIGSRALVDGLEMLCELSESHGAALATAPASLSTLEDVDRAGAYIKSLGDEIVRQASTMVFARIPRIAANALGSTSPTGSFPALSGRMGEEVARLRESLVAARSALPVISGAMQQVGAEMQGLRATIDQKNAQNDIIDYELLSTTLDRLGECAQSFNVGSLGVGSAVGCAYSAAQIGIAMRVASLQKRAANDSVEIARASFAERMSQLTQNLQSAALGLQDSGERINGALSAIEGLRKQARLSMAKAVHLGSYQSQKQVQYNQALGSLTALAQVRYERALDNAKKMTFIAKRSIEQRLGVRLSEMRDPLPLVDAPSTWEGTLCSLGGTNDVGGGSNGSSSSPSEPPKDIAKFGDAFIGDYVNKLANLVESYSLAFNFHEGDDVAVVSLRDDVKNVRKACAVESKNLFRDSAVLDADSWTPTNCTASPPVNCVSAVPLVDGTKKTSEFALTGLASNVSAAVGYKLRFGPGSAGAQDVPSGTCPSSNCTWRPEAALSQIVQLQPGRYRLSWYSRDAAALYGAASSIVRLRATGTLPAPVLVPADKCNAPCGVSACGTGCFSYPLPVTGATTSSGTWKRMSVEFTVSDAGAYEVGFGVVDATRPSYTVTLAAPMLEEVLNATATQLAAFQATSSDGMIEFEDCEDTGGELFRANHWRRECMHLCDTGFSSNCTNGPEYCYREMSFGVSQPWIQNGKLFNYSGFARGNFNYRIDSLALNFVGSGVRDCAGSTTPSTCFNAGFIPYSVEHNGPFFVRNHAGADFKALLFDGRIEHARGLASERYLTNPLSATDRELLSDYMRTEFQGRPLDGTFVVRVWEEPGVDFDSIQDVQLLLKYRYWTRFE